MPPLEAWELANAVTGFATTSAGLLMLALSWLVGGQPRRWWAVYWAVLATGVCTVTFHGLGETHGWRVCDVGSNLFVVWTIVVAVLGDLYTPTLQRRAGGVLGVLVLVAIAGVWYENPALRPRTYVIALGRFGGFYMGETVLIVLAWTIAGLLYARRAELPRTARPLLNLLFIIFVAGMGLAIAKGETVTSPFFAYHAIWHIVGAFGFVTCWIFNHVRFAATE